jgi:SAM-dependent methyltransferase
VCSDVYDSSAAVDGERFDIVYTGLGAVNWLDDIERWAATMASVCKPGGTFYLAEFHPVAATFDDESTEPVLVPRYGYFGHEWHDTSETYTGSYGAQDAATQFNDTHERVWTLGEVVSAIAGAGFRLEFLHEHDFTLYESLRFLVRTERGYELPEGLPRIPMMYSLRAVRR